MDVSCPRCDAVYEFDIRRLRGGKATLKCSQCGHLFRLEGPGKVLDESQRRWMVRKETSGDILYFTGFDTLHEWIMEGRIGGEDAISRTGGSWKVLREIGEFTPIFQVLESIARLKEAASASSKSGPREAASPVSEKLAGGAKSDKLRTLPGKPASPVSEEAPSVSAETPEKRLRRPTRSGQSTIPGKPGQVTAREMEAQAVLGRSGSEHATVPGRPLQPTGPGLAPPPPARRATEAAPGRPRARTEIAGPNQTLEYQEAAGALGKEEQRGEEKVLAPDPHEGIDSTKRVSVEEPGQEEWSLGELELPPEKFGELAQKKKRRSSVPLLLFLMVVLLAGLGFWQREMLEELWDESRSRSEVSTSGNQGSVVAVGDVGGLGGDATQAAREEIITARQRAEVRQEFAPVVEAARQEAMTRVAEALEEGRMSAVQAAQPSVRELLQRGRRSLDRGDGRSALRRFEEVLDQEPNNREALIGVAWAYLAMGNLDTAAARFRGVIRNDPGAEEALIGLGRAERDRRNPEAALRAYEEYLERFPSGPSASIARFQSEQLRESLSQ